MKMQISIPVTILLFLISPCSSKSEKCNPQDKKALLQFKKDLNNPYTLTCWDPSFDCCNWCAVECDRITNRINAIGISAPGDLSWQIPASVADLPYLENLRLHKVNLTGTIPQTITKLTRLKYLDLSWNKLSGPIPSFLSEIKSLNSISLSFNNFTGSIPPSLSELPNLYALALDRNQLTGNIPELSFGKFSGRTLYLYLSHNQLSGELPNSFGNLNFSTLDLSRNKLEGDISFLFGTNKTLDTADFSRNLFEFDLSKIKFPESLENLDINHNKIFGNLPVQMTELRLQFLNVSYNRLCGQIPVGGRLQSYETTEYFHNRCLCGSPLPACK